MEDPRNVRKVYNMMRYDGNHQNWCGKIKELLIHFNFEDVWDLQQVEQTQSRYKEMYLNHNKPEVIRRLLSRFRIGVNVKKNLTHKKRFVNDKETVCPMCTEHEEDDIHFLLHCPVYHVKYIGPFNSPPPQMKYLSILCYKWKIQTC